jgi:uncharacterized membrane protein YqhA
MFQRLENAFERSLWSSRWLVLVAVLASLLAALVLMLIGAAQVALVVHEAFHAFSNMYEVEQYQLSAVSKIIAAVDVFLIATVLLIFGVGLYELFISRIKPAEREGLPGKVMLVKDLDELKDRLAKVVIMALVVAFFKAAIGLKVESFPHLLYMAGSILLAAASLFVVHRAGGK